MGEYSVTLLENRCKGLELMLEASKKEYKTLKNRNDRLEEQQKVNQNIITKLKKEIANVYKTNQDR